MRGFLRVYLKKAAEFVAPLKPYLEPPTFIAVAMLVFTMLMYYAGGGEPMWKGALESYPTPIPPPAAPKPPAIVEATPTPQ